MSHNVMRSDGARYTDVAHDTIQVRRAELKVPCEPGGFLHDYVPFYFCTKSPMLYAISRRASAKHTAGQEPMVYLVSTVEDVEQQGLPSTFTDGHGTKFQTRYFNDLDDLDSVDWPLMKAKWWNDTQEDLDRCRRRSAEFLVRDHFPWALVRGVGVIDGARSLEVAAILKRACPAAGDYKPRVVVRPGWYY